MNTQAIDFTDTKEILIRLNGKFIYISYQLDDSPEYKAYLLNKVLN